MSRMLWLLEPDVFDAGTHPLRAAAVDAGHRVKLWDDEWWNTDRFPSLDGPVVFHGSLGNAARIAKLGRWTPGAYCNAEGFRCSAWYSAAGEWLVHEEYASTTVAALVERPGEVARHLVDADGKVFVRPDSPLKPFSGRVVSLEGLKPADLDHGFYYDDLELPVVVTKTQSLGAEYRFVIARKAVVTGCRYEADGRSAAGTEVPQEVSDLAGVIATTLRLPTRSTSSTWWRENAACGWWRSTPSAEPTSTPATRRWS